MKVVYNSFDGRYSDNPRALYEALVAEQRPLEHRWLAAEAHGAGFPAGVPTVPAGTRLARQALEEADVVISNTHVELEWDKPAGSLYLQTWHGTPLKRIHHDVLWAPDGRLEQLSRDVRRWDALLSPNAASTPLLRQAFAFDGDVLESGYPRNDVLAASGAEQVRERVRRELGLPDGAQVVLYAPTWRDDVTLGPDADRAGALQLDLADLTARLPEAHVLLRLHYFDTGRLAAGTLPRVHDLSFHPDISELYLAADVLVTDYSSVMFDFAVTGKPLLFFTYDLARYGAVVRGFYVDLAEIAPGPLLATSHEVVDALLDLPAVTAAHRQAYARFRERYCSLEDGGATRRVLDRYLPAQRTAGEGLPA